MTRTELLATIDQLIAKSLDARSHAAPSAPFAEAAFALADAAIASYAKRPTADLSSAGYLVLDKARARCWALKELAKIHDMFASNPGAEAYGIELAAKRAELIRCGILAA